MASLFVVFTERLDHSRIRDCLDRIGFQPIIQPGLNYFAKAITMSDEASDKTELETLLAWLKVIAEPKRLQIVNLIMQGIQCNCEISEALGVGPTLISHHMKILTQSGLVDVERDTSDARWVYYSINTRALAELSRVFGDFFDPDRIQPRHLTCGPGLQVVNTSNRLIARP